MAKITEGLPLTGNLGMLSAFKMRGVDGIVVRRKGGPTKEQVKTSPRYERLRENNREWEGCSKGAAHIKLTLSGITHLADHNLSSHFTGVGMKARLADLLSDRGKRNILFSRTRHMLEGYELNRKVLFNSVIRVAPAFTLYRTDGSANIIIPEMTPGIHLKMPWNYPVFRFIITLGVVPDMMFSEQGYKPSNGLRQSQHVMVRTDWFSSRTEYEGQTLSLQPDNLDGFSDYCSLILTIGLEAGTTGHLNVYEPVNYMGCGKIISVV